MNKNIFLILILGLILAACSENPVIKKRAYPRVHYPENTGYTTLSPPDCPYSFEIASYITPERKTKFFDSDVTGNCWLNLVCEPLNATIYLSYKKMSPELTLLRLMEEAYELTYKHTNKADFIQPKEIENGNGSVGLIYYVGGDAASNIQFFLTDTTSHFVRGALYFYTRPNVDSLKPVVEFMVQDIEQLMESWEWK